MSASDVVIELDIEATEDPVVTAVFRTPWGTLIVMAEVTISGGTLHLAHVHVHSADVGPREFGVAPLRATARAVMEEFDVTEILVNGARRTTGAGPGRTPGRVRFTRARTVEDKGT